MWQSVEELRGSTVHHWLKEFGNHGAGIKRCSWGSMPVQIMVLGLAKGRRGSPTNSGVPFLREQRMQVVLNGPKASPFLTSGMLLKLLGADRDAWEWSHMPKKIMHFISHFFFVTWLQECHPCSQGIGLHLVFLGLKHC